MERGLRPAVGGPEVAGVTLTRDGLLTQEGTSGSPGGFMKNDKRPLGPDSHKGGSGGEEPPPFRPDPRLVTYLERGREDDAPERLRKALRDLDKHT